jgi:hypothetical protein
MKSLLFFFAFITVFQAIGMVILGTTLRGILLALREHGWKGVRQVNAWLVRLIVGGGFVLISTLAGYSELSMTLKILQVVIGLAAFIASLIGIRQRLFSELQANQISMIIFGAIFFIIGMATAGEMLRQREIFPTLIFGLFFCGLGAATLIMGLRSLVDGK